jgi:hypothetical protein
MDGAQEKPLLLEKKLLSRSYVCTQLTFISKEIGVQCRGRFLGIIGRDPSSVSKSNWLHAKFF